MPFAGRSAVRPPRARGLRTLIGLLALLVACLFPGCGGAPSPGDGEAWAADHGPSFLLPELAGPPVRVVPVSAGAVDLICSLLPPERVAALPAQALRYSGLREGTSPHLALPTFTVYESERILVFGPDLVVAQTTQSADTTARLRAAGVPVLLLPDANTWPAVREQLLMVARLVDAEPEAQRLVGRYDQRLVELRTSLEGQPRPTALCYSNGGAGGWVAGADTTNDEVLQLAGLRDLAAEAGRRGHSMITYEELLVLDPDLIVVGGQADAQQAGGTAALLQTAAPLAGLRAVREGRILVLDSWLYTATSQHLVDAAVELARLAEPFRDLAR